MTDDAALPAAGWYSDPANTGRLRWWDGASWTDHFQAAMPTPAYPAYAPVTQYVYAPTGPVYPPAPPVGFLESITKVFRNYAVFTGVASRSEFWWFYLAFFLASIAALVVDLILFAVLLSIGAVWPFIFTWVFSIACFGIIVPGLAVTVRRLRDAGYPWPWIFISYVPVIGGIWLIVLLAAEPAAVRPQQTVYAPQG